MNFDAIAAEAVRGRGARRKQSNWPDAQIIPQLSI